MKIITKLAISTAIFLSLIQISTNAFAESEYAKATFAGGCFWCMEPPYDKLEGVISTTSGYAGGSVKNPSYREVTTGRTGHTEVVQVEYDPDKIDYEALLQVFWLNIDPLVKDRQFCDKGTQYRTAIFFHNEEQEQLARASLQAIQKSGRFEGEIYTEIEPLDAFYAAEDYHQDYYRKNPSRYKYYRFSCGRDDRLDEIWGDASQAFQLDSSK